MPKNVEIASRPSGGHLCLLQRYVYMLQPETAMQDTLLSQRKPGIVSALPESHAMPSVHQSLTIRIAYAFLLKQCKH